MTKTIDAIIGCNLRRIRELRGKTRAELSGALNPPISAQAVEKYESGQNRISASTLADLALILECQVADFFDGVDGVTQFNEDEAALLRAYRSIGDPSVQEIIRNLAKHFTRSKPHA